MSSLESFELGGIRFIMDIRDGRQRGKSVDNEFILVKTKPFLDYYRNLQSRQPKQILEIGMFEGGSLVLFDKLFQPDTLMGLDIRRDPIQPLEAYRKDRPHIETIYGLSQDDDAVSTILAARFPEGIDLVVDDASHLYQQSRKTFDLCFPHVKPGGLYVLEDWSWSHKKPYQAQSHPWYDKPALTNLVIELLVNVPGSRQIESLTIHRDLIVIEKALSATGSTDLQEGLASLRGRQLPVI